MSRESVLAASDGVLQMLNSGIWIGHIVTIRIPNFDPAEVGNLCDVYMSALTKDQLPKIIICMFLKFVSKKNFLTIFDQSKKFIY